MKSAQLLLSFYKISKNRLDQCFWSSNCAVGEIGIYGLSAGSRGGRRAEERKALTSIKEALPMSRLPSVHFAN